MASTQFSFNGQTYQVDNKGTIYQQINGKWAPVAPSDQNAALQQAATVARGGPATSTAPPPDAAPGGGSAGSTTAPTVPTTTTAPATTSSSGGISAAATVHQTGTTSLVPPDKPSIPATAPRAGVGSATELRTQRDKLQKQLDDVWSRINAGQGDSGTAGIPSNTETSLIASATRTRRSLLISSCSVHLHSHH